MTRLEYTENVRSMRAAIDRDPADAAFMGIMCLTDDQIDAVMLRMAKLNALPTAKRKIVLTVECVE